MTHTSTYQDRAEPIKMQPGDDLHLTMLMAPHGLNFVTGKDREHLLAWGRDVWQAARRAQVVPQGWKLVPEVPTMEMVASGDKSRKASSWLIGGANAVPATYAAMLAAAPQPPDANSVELHQIKNAAPVQMPESISKVLEDCRSRAIDYATCPSPYNNTRLETAFQSLEHQVRQLLASKPTEKGG